MSDDDLGDGLGDERLRAAFRHGGTIGGDPRTVDADDFLARVRAGSRRRRARRTVGVVAAAAAAVGIVVTGVTSVVSGLDPPGSPVAQEATASSSTPTADGGPSATATTLRRSASSRSLAVYDVHVADDRSVWALASRECGRAELCPVIANSTDDGATWRSRSVQTAGGDEAIPAVRDLAIADNGTDIVVAGQGIAASHDAGATWRPADIAAGSSVRDLAAGAAEAVAIVEDAGDGAVVTSPMGSDTWSAARLPVSSDERVGTTFAGGDVVGATVTAATSAETTALVARTSGSDWVRLEAPCASRTPLVATDGSTLWYLCYGGSTSVLAATAAADGLQDPAWVTTELPAADNAGLGAWNDGTAVVSVNKRVFRVDSRAGTDELTGSSSGLELARGDYTYRATDQCWLTSFRGQLLHTTDNAQSWSPVRLR